MKPNKCQNKNKVKENDKGRDKEGPAKARKVAGRPGRYKLPKEGISGEDTGLGSEVHGVREGTGEYGPSERTPREGEDSTRPLDSTPYFETAQGIKTYSEVSEILAVSVAKTIETIIDGTPEEINITSEWICKLHGNIASPLFPNWAGRILLSAVLFKLRLPPAETASVEPEEKERYLKALRDADGGDMLLLTTIWIERLSKAFYEKR